MHFLLFFYNILCEFAVCLLLEIIIQAKYCPHLLTAVKQSPRSVKRPGYDEIHVEPMGGFSSGNLGVLHQGKSSQGRWTAMCP